MSSTTFRLFWSIKYLSRGIVSAIILIRVFWDQYIEMRGNLIHPIMIDSPMNLCISFGVACSKRPCFEMYIPLEQCAMFAISFSPIYLAK